MKKRSGGWRTIASRRYMRIRVGEKKRLVVPLTGVRSDAEADARCAVIADVAESLLDAGRVDRVEQFARDLGAATTVKRIEQLRKGATQVIELGVAAPKGVTFRDWAKRWTSGELARLYPDHVKKSSHVDSISRLTHHVLPYVGDVPIASFTLENAEYVMAKIPAKRGAATRRHVAQVMNRLLVLAVYPGKLRAANPLPKGFLPKVGAGAAKVYLYPDDDALLLACTEIPLARRLVYGILAREGMRSGELLGCDKKGEEREPMAWAAASFERCTFRLDENKTDDPRTWAMDPGVARALRAWWHISGEPSLDARVVPVHPRLGNFLRDDLKLAKVKRPELFERTTARRPVRVHDLRATFVTLSLANGKTETWVADRTGHASSEMIARYRRSARTAAELKLGALKPLDQAIPELRKGGAEVGQKARRKTGHGGRSK